MPTTSAPARRLTNVALLVLLGVAFATGGLAYATGAGWGFWVVAAHGVAGLAIVVLVPWKQAVVRSGMRKSRPSQYASIALGVLVVVVVVTGVLHATGVWATVGALSALNIHVGAAIALFPLALWHATARRVRPKRTDFDRRAALKAAGVVGGAAAVWVALDGIPELASSPGADRRFTGSHEVGSFVPARMPTTIWFNDAAPSIDPAAYVLRVRSPAGTRELTYSDLQEFDDVVRATIDCTGGWYSTQEWGGVRLDRLLDDLRADVDARSILIGSRTGYARRFPLEDKSKLWLAARIGGEPLGRGHGFPLRLVAPGRRGFWWVKWVDVVRVERTPSWWQPPFPLT